MRCERRSLLRLRGEGGEGLRRRRGGLRLLSLRRESRCLNDMGLLARLCGDDLLGLDLCPHDITLFNHSHPQDPKASCVVYALLSQGTDIPCTPDLLQTKQFQNQSQGCTWASGHRAMSNHFMKATPCVAMYAPGHDKDVLETRHMQRHAG